MKKPALILIAIFFAEPAASNCVDETTCVQWANFSSLVVSYKHTPETPALETSYYQVDDEIYMDFVGQTRQSILLVPGVGELYLGFGDSGVTTHKDCYDVVGESISIGNSWGIKTLYLLSRVAPDGPATINDRQIVNVVENERTELAITPSNSVFIQTPWLLSSELNREDDILTFELRLTSGEGENRYRSSFVGSWKATTISSPIADTETLDEWLVCLFNPIEDGSQPMTIGDIRRLRQ